MRLFLFEKKIIYLTFFWDGVKKSSAGFVKVSRERDTCRLDIHIKHIDGLDDGKYALYLVLRSREAEWGCITVKDGAVNEEKCLPVYRGKFRSGEEEFDEDELCGVLIRLDKNHWISGCWQETNDFRENTRNDIQDGSRDDSQKNIREEVRVAENKGDDSLVAAEKKKEPTDLPYGADGCIRETIPEDTLKDGKRILLKPALGNKWEQLQRVYGRVHPFGDERLYLTIEPKDFIVLQAPYQRLVNNSFLLHGYYNYRHLILGPDEEIGTGNEICFYLGVPGTYFEREKMVAVMFGFEGFECAGPVEIGKFGYYMRRVEL